jgi:hypothetical protein
LDVVAQAIAEVVPGAVAEAIAQVAPAILADGGEYKANAIGTVAPAMVRAY